MHAAELAEQIQVKTVIVPQHPGLFSALGMMLTDMKYAYVKGVLKRLDELSEDFFEETWQLMTKEAVSNIRRLTEGSNARITSHRSVDVRYLGQGFELEVQAPGQFSCSKLRELFEEKHEAVYGYRHSGEPLEITAIRLTLAIALTRPTLSRIANPNPRTITETHRSVWFNDQWFDTPVWWRDNLRTAQPIRGPAIIEGYDSTTVIPPGWKCTQSEHQCLVMEREK